MLACLRRTSAAVRVLACFGVLLIAVPACRGQERVAPPVAPLAPPAAAVVPQEQPPPAEPRPPSAQSAAPGDPATLATVAAAPPGPTEAAGRATLAAAAKFQRGDTPRSRPTSLRGNFHVGVRDKDGTLIQASVSRWYTAAPERLLTSRTESVTGSRSTVGFDGRRAWFRDDRTGRVIVYTDAPETYNVDLDLIQEQPRLTRRMLDAFVLDALPPRLHGVRTGARESIQDPDGEAHAVQHVLARAADELHEAPGAGEAADAGAAPELVLDFGIDADSGALWSVRVLAVGRRDVPALELRFAFHGTTPSGLRVPGNIRVYRDGETLESVRLGVGEDAEGRLDLDIDAPVDPALFAVPAS